jgi:hypothetical protein
VRLYDVYSDDLFEAALAASGSVETAAKATQTAFLRILRRPPALDAPDSEVAGRLRRLVPGGPIDPAPLSNGGPHQRAIDVGWLRSETVAMAGARFDNDWSVHLWTPSAEPEEQEQPDAPSEPAPRRRRFARSRRGPASPTRAAALVALTLLGGALGTFLTGGGQRQGGVAPAAATREQPVKPQKAKHSGDPRPERRKPDAPSTRAAVAGTSSPDGLGTKTRELAMKPPPSPTAPQTEEQPAEELPAEDIPQPATPPGAEQDGSAGDHRNCHSKKATDSC